MVARFEIIEHLSTSSPSRGARDDQISRRGGRKERVSLFAARKMGMEIKHLMEGEGRALVNEAEFEIFTEKRERRRGGGGKVWITGQFKYCLLLSGL